MREFWEERYAAPDFVYGTEPNAFLVAQAHRLPAGARVLVIGDGEGRNGVWLAQQGHRVLSVDYAEAGLAKARRLAAERGVALATDQADLTEWDWPGATFDAVVSIFLHFAPDLRPLIHARVLGALAPGGLLILEAFHKDQLGYGTGGPPVEALLYTADQLRGDLAGAHIELIEEAITQLDEGPFHAGQAAVVRLVARRPEALG